MTQTQATVSKPIAELANLLRELQEALKRHGTSGFYLMFTPEDVELPEDYVLVQRINPTTGEITLVPTKIDDCGLADILLETQIFDLSDETYIKFVEVPGRRHLCTVGNGCHVYQPK